MALRIVEQAGRTDVGRQRSANEDALVLSPPFFAVADGMGGARAGEVASSLAAGVFGEELDSGEAPETQLTRIAQEANRRIFELAATDESHRGMGTTLTAAKVHDDEVSLGHVGDSRAYLLRDGVLEQLTRDHSLVAELERTGQITPEAAEHHPAALDHHARARARAARGRGHLHRDRPRRGPLPDLLGRAHEHGHGRRAGGDPALGGIARGHRGGARARRQPERRQGQHHRRAVPPRRRRRIGGAAAAADETIPGTVTADEVRAAAPPPAATTGRRPPAVAARRARP